MPKNHAHQSNFSRKGDYMQRLGKVIIGPMLFLMLIGCTLFAPETKATPGQPTSVYLSPTPTATQPPWVEAVVYRDSHIWTGPAADATDLGQRPAGTSVQVIRATGDRFLVTEQHDPNKPAWIDIPNIAMSEADWKLFQPKRTQTAVSLCLPGASSLPQAVRAQVATGATNFAEGFVEFGAPGLTMIVRSGIGNDAVSLQVTLETVNAFVGTPPPTPGKFAGPNSPAKATWDPYQTAVAGPVQKLNATNARVQQFAGALQDLKLPIPTKMIVLVTNLGEAESPAPSLRLHGIRVSLLTYCPGVLERCQPVEDKWLAALGSTGALSVRAYEATSHFSYLAFQPVAPELH
jgi:hypothetical protein